MPDRDHRVTRREFLTTASAGAALAVAAAKAQAQQDVEKRNMQPDMTYRVLGRANLMVSCLSFGCLELQDDRLNVLDMAVERGVNVVHVNRGYNEGRSIESLGKFLANKRDRVFVMLKSNALNIDNDLQTLNTDHVDVLCRADLTPAGLRNAQLREQFEQLRQAGKARFLNLTSHNEPQACVDAAVDCGLYECSQATINLSILEGFKPTLKKAMDSNVGTIAMKTMHNNGGASPQEVVRALLGGGTTTVLKTLSSVEAAEAFLSGVTEEVQIGGIELKKGLAHGRMALAAGGVCTLCGACTACPKGVAVQDVLRNYQYYCQQLGNVKTAREQYAYLQPEQTPTACINCGTCESVCPQRLAVRSLIHEAHGVLVA